MPKTKNKRKHNSAHPSQRKNRKNSAVGDLEPQETNTVPVKRPKTRPLKVSLKVVGLSGDPKGKCGTIVKMTGKRTQKRWHVMWDGEQALDQCKGHQLQAAKDLEPTPTELSAIFNAAGGGQAGMDAAVGAGAIAYTPIPKPVANIPPKVRRGARVALLPKPLSSVGALPKSPIPSPQAASPRRPQRDRKRTARYATGATDDSESEEHKHSGLDNDSDPDNDSEYHPLSPVSSNVTQRFRSREDSDHEPHSEEDPLPDDLDTGAAAQAVADLSADDMEKLLTVTNKKTTLTWKREPVLIDASSYNRSPNLSGVDERTSVIGCWNWSYPRQYHNTIVELMNQKLKALARKRKRTYVPMNATELDKFFGCIFAQVFVVDTGRSCWREEKGDKSVRLVPAFGTRFGLTRNRRDDLLSCLTVGKLVEGVRFLSFLHTQDLDVPLKGTHSPRSPGPRCNPSLMPSTHIVSSKSLRESIYSSTS
jgi:hypothetical protein